MLLLKDLAIKKALENNWQEACLINEQILKQSPDDIDSLNRLGFSLIKLGNFKKAKEIYGKVVNIDQTNPIALKNIRKIDEMIKQHIEHCLTDNNRNVNLRELFIEEAGKTKIVDLKNIADKKTLSTLQVGDFVTLIIKRSKIFIQVENKYVGMLPDNIGTRLIPFIKEGNEYRACIKSLDDKNVSIFIKETKRSSKLKNQPSFTITHNTPSGNFSSKK